MIIAGATSAVFAAKAATATIPIVFATIDDPVNLGLVASLARPDGNLTGINWFASELAAKRLELLRELVPGAARIALLVEPANVRITEGIVRMSNRQPESWDCKFGSYAGRQDVEAGGLMSYGASLTDASRQMGVYAGRMLKGAKPADLPIMQATKFELVINLKTAKALGLDVPPMLLARADEVIE